MQIVKRYRHHTLILLMTSVTIIIIIIISGILQMYVNRILNNLHRPLLTRQHRCIQWIPWIQWLLRCCKGQRQSDLRLIHLVLQNLNRLLSILVTFPIGSLHRLILVIEGVYAHLSIINGVGTTAGRHVLALLV